MLGVIPLEVRPDLLAVHPVVAALVLLEVIGMDAIPCALCGVHRINTPEFSPLGDLADGDAALSAATILATPGTVKLGKSLQFAAEAAALAFRTQPTLSCLLSCLCPRHHQS